VQVGIRTNQLYYWKQEQEGLKAVTMLSADDKAELMRLRKENKQLRMEKEILKKASVFSVNYLDRIDDNYSGRF
jgi:transposase